MRVVNQSLFKAHDGYTFIELMVALAVSSIVIAGSYAGYSLLARQQQFLNAQTSVDRNALRVVDLMQSDMQRSSFLVMMITDSDLFFLGIFIFYESNTTNGTNISRTTNY